MSDNNSDGEVNSGLPPKLRARKIVPTGSAQSESAEPAEQVQKPVQPAAVTPKPTGSVTKISMDSAKPVDGVKSAPRVNTLQPKKVSPPSAPMSAKPEPPKPASSPGTTPKPTASVTKIAMDTVKPVDGVKSAPRVNTLKAKKVTPPAAAASAKPAAPEPATVKPPAAKPVVVSKPAAAAQASAKSGTVRISLDETTAPAQAPTGGAAEAAKGTDGVVKIAMDTAKPGDAAAGQQAAEPGAQTVRVKKPPEAKTVEPKAAASPDAGPSTIRLKKPTSSKPVKRPAKPKDGYTETARITLDDEVTSAEGPAETAETATGGPKTIRIKRPDESPTAKKVTAPTMKVKRAGATEEDEEAPVTQRKTIGVKRRTAEVSDRSSRMAEQEEILMKGRGKSRDGADLPVSRERRAWAWCLLSIAASVVIGFVIWMFCVQLMPKHEKMKWWGRILGQKDAFFDGEIDWLTGKQQYRPSTAPPAPTPPTGS